MSDFRQAAFFTVLGGALSAAAGFWIGGYRRTRDAKDVFGVFIREQIASMPDRGILKFYLATKPSVHLAVQRVWHFLGSEQRIALDKLWAEYNQIQEEQLSEQKEFLFLSGVHKHMEDGWESPQNLIKRHLESFYTFSA